MAKTYTTIQGETWDEIAYKVYGGEEYAAFLMAEDGDEGEDPYDDYSSEDEAEDDE